MIQNNVCNKLKKMKLPSYLIGMVLFITLFVIVCANSYHKKIMNKEKYSDLSSFSSRLLTIHNESIEEIRKLHLEIEKLKEGVESIECDAGTETICPSNCDIYSYFSYNNSNYTDEDQLKSTNSNDHCVNNPCATFEYTYHVGLSNCPDQDDDESRVFTITDTTLCGDSCGPGGPGGGTGGGTGGPGDGPGGGTGGGTGGPGDDGPGGQDDGQGGLGDYDSCTFSTYFEYNDNQYDTQDKWDSQLSNICSSNLCSNISYSLNTDYTNCPENLSNISTQLTHKCDDPSCSLYCEEATKYATINEDEPVNQYDSLEDLKNNVCTFSNLFYNGNSTTINYQQIDGSNCDGQFIENSSTECNVVFSNFCSNYIQCRNQRYNLEYVFDNESYADSNELKQSVCQESNFNKCDDIIRIKYTTELSECINSNDDGYYEKMNEFAQMGFWCDDMCKFHQPRTSNCVGLDSEYYFDINGTINDREGLSRSYSNITRSNAIEQYSRDICNIVDSYDNKDVCDSNVRFTMFGYSNDKCDDNPVKYSLVYSGVDWVDDPTIFTYCPHQCV